MGMMFAANKVRQKQKDDSRLKALKSNVKKESLIIKRGVKSNVKKEIIIEKNKKRAGRK